MPSWSCKNLHEKSENFEKSHFSQNSQCIFYKSEVSKKEQAKKGSNGQELREVVPFDV